MRCTEQPFGPGRRAGGAVRARREDDEELNLPDEAPTKPPFACLSSGELTPLRWEFRRSDVGETWRLEGQFDGTLTLTAVPDAR